MQQQQQQKQSLAPPPLQTKKDAAEADESVPDAQGETPMEQEDAAEGRGAKAEPKDGEGTEERGGMPEHPGRDSDSDGEGSGQEEE